MFEIIIIAHLILHKNVLNKIFVQVKGESVASIEVGTYMTHRTQRGYKVLGLISLKSYEWRYPCACRSKPSE